jgi:hypothetical protein
LKEKGGRREKRREKRESSSLFSLSINTASASDLTFGELVLEERKQSTHEPLIEWTSIGGCR